jgi:transposase
MPVSAASATPGGKCSYSRCQVTVETAAINTIAPSANPQIRVQGVQSAPLPARIIDKGLASDRVVIDTVVSKYADHVPLYREHKRPGSKTY